MKENRAMTNTSRTSRTSRLSRAASAAPADGHPSDGAARSGSRRGLIVGLGAAALGGVGAFGAAGPAEAAVPAKNDTGSVTRARLVSDLAKVKADDGDIAIATGYHKPGDVGGLV